MPKRFFLRNEVRTARVPRFAPRRAHFVYLAILLGCLILAFGFFNHDGNQNTDATPGRHSIGSTETSTLLAPVLTQEVEVPVVISTVQDTTVVVPPDSTLDSIKEAETKLVPKTPDLKKVLPSVTLFNGCGVKGIGARAKSALEKMGFQVVEVRNARSYNYKKSEVLDRREDLSMGRVLADSLGISKQLAAWDTTRSDRDADVSLIVGSDFRKLRWKI